MSKGSPKESWDRHVAGIISQWREIIKWHEENFRLDKEITSWKEDADLYRAAVVLLRAGRVHNQRVDRVVRELQTELEFQCTQEKEGGLSSWVTPTLLRETIALLNARKNASETGWGKGWHGDKVGHQKAARKLER